MPEQPTEIYGPNAWLVDEMYERYAADPSSVSESWREFFEGYTPDVPAPAPPTGLGTLAVREEPTVAVPAAVAATPTAPAPATPTVDEGVLLLGPAGIIAQNMTASLSVPTATSFRVVPAKLLEVNRRAVNLHLARTGRPKVSFTHLIGYAVVRAIAGAVPTMNSTYVTGADGRGRVVRNEHLHMGLAVDVEKPDGSRTLVVPVLKDADTLDFAGFWGAYEDLIRKVRTNKLAVTDFQGATITLTNPGTIGTVQSVPRLMPGQGVIVGVGAIDYPAEWQAADERVVADLGVSKVVTVTSTYDHRIIQGAESGLFLRRVHDLLLGGGGFYDGVFASLGLPYEPVRWQSDTNPLDREEAGRRKQMAVSTLVRTHRVRGHLIADLDPLRWKRDTRTAPELDPATYGLTLWDLEREFLTNGLAGRDRMTLNEVLEVLRDAYCRTIGIEYMHIQELDEQRWIQGRVEGVPFELSHDELRHLLGRLNAAEAFERFLATKYVGHKRFGLEGGESAIVVLDAVLSAAADDHLDRAVIGMAHRGRLNVLANIVGKSYEQIFKEFEGQVDPMAFQGSGDVKYHLGAAGKYPSPAGNDIEVELAANPSHLEAVNPVVLGMARARQDHLEPKGAFNVLPVLVHGDAAFAGQGVVAECLAMYDIAGYRVGGTVHLVIDNQIGFTTAPNYARSSHYATDVAKMVQAPVFHVNGDDPEACVRVARLAYEYRQAFHKDVVIDMVCYRRHGHNEGDDPSYTQPLMYKRIDEQRSVRKLFTEALVKRGAITIEEAEAALDDFQSRLQAALDETRQAAPEAPTSRRPAATVGVLPHVVTGVERPTLDRVFDALGVAPPGFTVHPKLARQFEQRARTYHADGTVDWATAEALAFGTLVLEGYDVRLAGEDSRRGTFSQRHACLVDYEVEARWFPLRHLDPTQGRFWVYDSLLSEYAALGFEYGYSVEAPGALVLWEAQFGDFVNGAQIIIDQFLVSGEDKWGQTSGLVLLLPHGFEGQGPEHSSARIERFLTLCAEDNIQVVNATTASQYFHVLRRQMHREVRKPLVVFTPKSLLRDRRAASPVDELTRGSFEEVLGDTVAEPLAVRRVVLCSGKVGFDAIARRDELGAPVAVVRVEQLYPFPRAELVDAVRSFPNARDLVWLQDEPENMGAWRFVFHHSHELTGLGYTLRQVCRAESGSPASGSAAIHATEQADLLARAFEGL